MGENICKWSNWQRINFQNLQAVHAAPYQKNKQPNPLENRQKTWEDISLKKIHRWQMKRYSSLAISEMQTKTTMRYHYTLRTTKIKGSDDTKCRKGYKETGPLMNCWWKCKITQLLETTVWQLLKKLNMQLSHDPTTAFAGIYPREMKSCVATKTCTQRFIAQNF